MLKRIIPISLLLFFVVPFVLATDSYAKKNIVIGVIGPMKFSHGQEMWNGALMAAEEINDRGGVQVGADLMPIKLIQVDSNEYTSVTSATSAIEMLFFRNEVDFVVGGFRSEAVLAMQDVAMDYKKIFISAGAAAPELTKRVAQNYDRYKYYFRGGTFNNLVLGKACFLQLSHVAQRLKQELGIKEIKVAIAAERNSWANDLIEAARQSFPYMGMELAGVFRISSVATEISSIVKSIADTRAPIVFTLFSGDAGINFVSRAADYHLPALMVGINTEAQRSDFWETTNGKADYVMTLASFAPDVVMSSKTTFFVDKYMQRFDSVPGYTAGGTYIAIANTLAPAIEQVNSLDSDLLVELIEKRKYETTQGIYAYAKDDLNRHTHEIKFGAGYALPIAIQWQDGQMRGVWPNKYRETPDALPFTYGGIVDFEVPGWVLKEYKRF